MNNEFVCRTDCFVLGIDDAILAAAAVSAASSAGGSIFSNLTNSNNTAKTNAANFQQLIQEENFNNQETQSAQMFSDDQRRRTEAYNADQAAIQRNWVEGMSSTAYQRQQADMRKAGLNPILGIASGGAPIGSGATASVGIPSSPVLGAPSANAMQAAHISDVIGPAVNSAMNTMQGLTALQSAITNMKNTAADTANKEVVNAGLQIDNVNKGLQGGLITAQTGREAAQQALASAQTGVQSHLANQLDASATSARAQATTEAYRQAEIQARLPGTVADAQRSLAFGSGPLGTAFGAIASAGSTGMKLIGKNLQDSFRSLSDWMHKGYHTAPGGGGSAGAFPDTQASGDLPFIDVPYKQ